MPTTLSVSHRYFYGPLGHVLWEVHAGIGVFAVSLCTETRVKSKLQPSDILDNPYLEELTPEAASELSGIPLEDAKGNVVVPRMIPVNTIGFAELVVMRTTPERIPHLLENGAVAKRFLFSMS